ncbi:hypothetical protein F53441_11463 [Fusarium austroafricanum]|uniref:SnoaL-like domain-containing protein n=1 Tax=Fusarium austroafricanum TaxID=2364996 RepID=A0A8H4NT40_9HYPO|nr:hypothetical protein F53441_11463 [Fusarium austroafricanum]
METIQADPLDFWTETILSSTLANLLFTTAFVNISSIHSKMAVSPEAAAIIQRKKAQYCRFADSNQWDRFDTIMLPNATYLFHDPDGSVITKGETEYSWSSREDWAAFFKNEFKEMQTIHIVGPAEMEQTAPDEIKAIWAVVYHAGTKEHEGGIHGTGGGHYYETWKKVGDDWYMADLRMERLYWKVLSS